MAAPAVIDLNADLGESFGAWRMGDDAALLDVVTSANVACGFHAGDSLTIARTCRVAAERGVVIGAHVSYRDLAGFGRRFVDVPPDDLYADVLYQIGALDGLARAAGSSVRYVKPHGALYNAVVDHHRQAEAVVRAVAHWAGEPLVLMGLPGAVILDLAAEAGVSTVAEAFADRAYTADGRLVPRSGTGAVIEDPAEAAQRAVRLATDATVTAIDGSTVRVDVRTICVHGDTPGAAARAGAIRDALRTNGATIAPFVPAR